MGEDFGSAKGAFNARLLVMVLLAKSISMFSYAPIVGH
jgi:hypothetical protein